MKGCCRTETGVFGRGRFEKLGLAGDTKLSSNTLKAVLENSGGGMKGGGLRGVKWGPSCLSSGCGRVVLCYSSAYCLTVISHEPLGWHVSLDLGGEVCTVVRLPFERKTKKN